MMNAAEHIYAVILAGGGGTRLWPKSRNQTPKQFLKLTSDTTMLQITAYRFAKLTPWDKIIVVTSQKYQELVQAQLPEIPAENIIVEPKKRDTAMAMLVGALYAKSKDPNAVIVNDAADHVIKDEPEFLRLMKAAADVATENPYLVAVGITPTFPSTAFGYIKIGEEIMKARDRIPVFKVSNFTEKPNQATARAFLATRQYFWNANHYVWAASTLQEAFKSHLPEVYEVTKSLETMNSTDFMTALSEMYDAVPSISIDYAISEKADNLVLIAGDFGWDDIGEWKVVYDLGTKDLAGNVVMGNGKQDRVHTLAIESQHNLIHANDRLIALIGVNDMIVVDTDEILMIAPMTHSQQVKKLVERLKEEGREEYL